VTIPYREQGYSVETRTVIVHERYQTHAPNALKVRTLEGVANIAAGRKRHACPVCFPAPAKPERKTPVKRTTKRLSG
jgi:hypothetical protein